MQLLKIKDPKVENKFLQCYLQVENIKLEEMRLYEKAGVNYIGNEKLLSEIREQYTKYKTAKNVKMEQFFDRQIIICNRSRGNDYIVLNIKEISKTPIFLVTNRHGAYFWGYKLSDFRAQKPIKMSADLIYGLYGMDGFLDLEDIPDFVNLYEVIKVKSSIIPCITGDTPGESNEPNPILVGYNESGTYWVTHRDLVKTMYYCDKYPGKCAYQTVDSSNMKKHLECCTDKPILNCRQVYNHSMANTI